MGGAAPVVHAVPHSEPCGAFRRRLRCSGAGPYAFAHRQAAG
ncbi:hypothetical protein HaLaN_21069, partial [Haematococcus lacustris]